MTEATTPNSQRNGSIADEVNNFDQEAHDALFQAGYSIEEIQNVVASGALDVDTSSDSQSEYDSLSDGELSDENSENGESADDL